MRAGQLRHKVTLQELGERIDDGTGGGSIPFRDVVTVNAAIEPLAGRELLLAGQQDTRMTHRVRTRYIPNVRPSWRVQYVDAFAGNTRVFDIKSVADKDERHRELELMCEELISW